MAQKRKVMEAFGPGGQLSAFAAAKLARESKRNTVTVSPKSNTEREAGVSVSDIGNEPYDGHQSDSSTSGAASFDEIRDVPTTRSNVIQLSTFQPSATNILQDGDESLELELAVNETATFVGEYDVTVLSGIVTIYGSVLRPTSGTQSICAPSTHALPQFQARQKGSKIRVSSISSGLQKLEALSPTFRNIWSSVGRSFRILPCSYDEVASRSLSGLSIEPDMDAVLRTLSAKVEVDFRKPRVMAVGTKSSGKSTFNRVLGNHLHSWTQTKKYLYLDLDPGQPEFGPPGQVSLVEVAASLLGPALAHMASAASTDYRVLRSHTIAATSFKDDPEHYKQCAVDLIQHANPRLPLIVNSCGWVNGLGAAVLADLVSLLAITDMILLGPPDATLQERIQSEHITLHKIARQPTRPSPRTPAELRSMQTMAYFHTRLSTSPSRAKWTAKPLTHMRHWHVAFADIFAIASYGQAPHPDFLAEVLDGSIVAIVLLDDDHVFSAADVLNTAENIPYLIPDGQGVSRTLDPRNSHTIGLALIRGLDIESQAFHLLTPLADSELKNLEQRIVLVRGSFDAPEWAYLEGVAVQAKGEGLQRPWVSERGMVGIEGAVWRLRHPPTLAAAVGTTSSSRP